MGTNGGIYIVYIVHLHLLDFTSHFQKKNPSPVKVYKGTVTAACSCSAQFGKSWFQFTTKPFGIGTSRWTFHSHTPSMYVLLVNIIS